MSRFVTLFLLCLVSTYGLADAQTALSPVKFTTFRHPAPGYFLLAPNSPDSIGLVDHSGQILFAVPAINSSTFQFADSTVTHFITNKRVFVRRNPHMEVVDTLRLGGDYPVDFHEGHMLSNGNYVVLGSDVRTIDMSALVPNGSPSARVTGAVFQERTLDGQTVFEWKSLDHIPVTDATEDVELFQTAIDYIHVNAVWQDTDGNFLVSCRHLDEIIKVSRTTGNIMWRLGGAKSKGNQFTFLNDNTGFVGFSHQHDVCRTSTGRIMMMDNGNLKPNPYSRAVEYEINETLKTARMTWSYRATPDLYAKGMGSVQELENGNVVIGWGTASQDIIAHEVSRDGTVQAELRTADRLIPTYRVMKAVFAMSGAERVVASPGTYTFTHGDSNTRVVMNFTRVDSPTSVITERHSVIPHNLSFTATAPCAPLPMRWVIRIKDTSKVVGTSRFALGSIPMVIVPSKVKLYHRPTEGIGKFTELTATYDATNTSLNTTFVRPGEYVLAYPMCYDPVPTSPSADAALVSLTPTLAWSEGLQTAGYDVEMYVASNQALLFAFRTLRLDTVVTDLVAGERYMWRVRARRPNPGPWSAYYSFRTRLGTPSGIWPKSLPDSLAVELRPIFSWSSVPHANSYRIQVFASGVATPVIDTVVFTTVFQWTKAFEYHTWYRWQVRAQLDAQAGAWSSQISFVTPPAPPELLSPLSEELDVDPDAAAVTWKAALGGMSYDVRLYKDVSPEAIFRDTVANLSATLPTLGSVIRYYWQVRTLSRYGASEWSPKRWFLTRGASVLPATILLTPVGTQNVDTVNTTLTWTPVEGATYYQVELTSKPSFSNPDFGWFDVRETSMVVPKLQSGRVYRWRVMALSDVAGGRWSTTANFTTLPSPSDLLRPLSPVNGSIDVPTQGFASFVTDAKFTGYRAEFSTEPNFSPIAYAIEGAISPLPYTLERGTSYWWRVVGIRNGLDLDTGSTAAFATVVTTSVVTGHSTPEEPQIVIRESNLEVRGAQGGSRVQIFDIMGRSVLTAIISGDRETWVQPLGPQSSAVYFVLVVSPDGAIAQASIFVGLIGS